MLLAARHRPNAALQVLSQVIACADPREGRVRHYLWLMHAEERSQVHAQGICLYQGSTGCVLFFCSCIACSAVRLAA